MAKLERRRDIRIEHVDIAAEIADERGEQRSLCTLRDFSRSGCQVFGADLDHIRSRVRIKIPGIHDDLHGRVVWREADVLGIEFDWDAVDPADRRNEVRHNATMATQIYDAARTKSIRCLIIDASANGCQIKCEDIRSLPEKVSLDIPGLNAWIVGVVRWRRENRAGIEFDWSRVGRLRKPKLELPVQDFTQRWEV